MDRVKACSLNPIDIKIRAGVYDDAPGFHIMGYDGAGTVLEAGADYQSFKAGDEVSWVGAPTRQESYADYQLASEVFCTRKAKSLDLLKAASYGLTFGTAYQSLYDRLEIKPNENASILIINGGGGAGSAAIQLAKNILQLPVVIATASRGETVDFCKRMGATHVVNHRHDLVEQIKGLHLDIRIKYVYIVAKTEQFIGAVAKICAPFGKVCTIVQADIHLYGTDFMSKSLTFAWDWLGSAIYHGTNLESYHKTAETLSRLIDEGKPTPTLTKRYRLNLAGIREAHRQIESGTAVGRVALGVDEPGEGIPFS